MADNKTNATDDSGFYQALVPQIGYIVLGSIGSFLSGLISLSLLLKSVEMRQGQRHILLTTMEIANFSLNFTHFLAGCFRLKYVLTGEYLLRVSAWQCMTRIYQPLFVFTLQFVPMTIFANACERFAAVYFCISYYHLVKTKHQVFVSLFMVGYCTAATAAAYLCSYISDQKPINPYTCVTNSAVGRGYTSYYHSITFVFTIFSAPVSLAAVASLIRKQKVGDTTLGNTKNNIPTLYHKRQKSLTHAIVLATLVAFLLMCPPMIANFITSALHIASVQWVELLIPYASFIIMSHSIFSDLILVSLNLQVRKSFKGLFGSILFCQIIKIAYLE